ncbi:uncharacterized protein PV07_00759 [Cladophialophora immunda]|uniref:Sister chromatid cohesion protein DCC1 n=1 Tax=Cladophialophora immunda TaxID=569365 RepID=A0A0D2CRZ7_9EURO|nr:uncharacterized protein PV07_00759 [Cladophialophora immunda]KIW33948.1 hypothetical protein PV07_00759 [Cladophialophora immunda]OQU94518.1 hypothetical protein CLAIMM_00867 [Cladophialophora immunda]
MSPSSSSQPTTFPPVAVSSTLPQQSLRLLELPPELLDVVETQMKNPSKRRKLWFKSSVDTAGPSKGQRLLKGFGRGASSPVTAAEEGKEGLLHLCADDKIWAVKQVSTSNSVYVTQTCQQPYAPQKHAGGQGTGGKDGDMPMAGAEGHVGVDGLAAAAGSRGGITTKAQVKNVLELIEVKSDERDIERKIHDMVAVYQDMEDDFGPLDPGRPGTGIESSGNEAVSSRDILDNISAPTRLIQDVMRKSLIFGLPQTTMRQSERHEEMAYLPTPSLLLRHWKEFLQQCTISSVNFEKNANVLPGKTVRGVLDGLLEAEETDEGRSLALNVTTAILRRFTDEDEEGRDPRHGDLPTLLDPDLSIGSMDEEQLLNVKLKFNPSLSRDMIGRWLLLSHARRRSSPSASSDSDRERLRVDKFMTEWTQLLPDPWAVGCDVSSLLSSVEGVEVAKDDEGEEVLRFASARGSHASGPSGTSHPSPPSGRAKDAQQSSQNQKKRKWHEKFGAQRTAPAAKK